MASGKKRVSRRKFMVTAGVAALGVMASGTRESTAADDKGYTEQNGLHVYKKDAKPKLPEGAPAVTHAEVVSLFGFKIVSIKDKEGKEKKMWMAASEKDYRESEAKRLGKKAADIKVHAEADSLASGCYQTGPMSCSGFCTGGFCTLVYNPSTHYYYCTCT